MKETYLYYKGGFYEAKRKGDTLFVPSLAVFAHYAGRAINIKDMPDNMYDALELVEQAKKPKRGRPPKGETDDKI